MPRKASGGDRKQTKSTTTKRATRATRGSTKAKSSGKLIDELGQLKSEREVANEAKSQQQLLSMYEELVERQQEQIEHLQGKKFTVPKQGRSRKSAKGWNRVIIPDTHGSRIDWRAMHVVLADIEKLKPKEIILLGDHVDCSGFLAQHHTLGFVAETEYTYEEDIEQANIMLDLLQKAAPKADIHYIQGNHEARLSKWCITQALRKTSDSQFLLNKIGVGALLSLEKRGIPYYTRDQKYMDLPVPGTIKLGSVFFTHGTRHGKNAHFKMLERFSAPIVFGHIHKLLSAYDNTVHSGQIGAWSCGCLCELQPTWKHADPSDWSLGYGVQAVRPDGGFLHLNIPILDGRSYMETLYQTAK